MTTTDALVTEMMRLSTALDEGLAALESAAGDYAIADDAYRASRASALLQATGKTVGEREAEVDLVCGDERRAQRIADGRRMVALEAVRSRRQQLSAAQSVANAVREEASLARTGPRGLVA